LCPLFENSGEAVHGYPKYSSAMGFEGGLPPPLKKGSEGYFWRRFELRNSAKEKLT
jgi:hypothetical protein